MLSLIFLLPLPLFTITTGLAEGTKATLVQGNDDERAIRAALHPLLYDETTGPVVHADVDVLASIAPLVACSTNKHLKCSIAAIPKGLTIQDTAILTHSENLDESATNIFNASLRRAFQYKWDRRDLRKTISKQKSEKCMGEPRKHLPKMSTDKVESPGTQSTDKVLEGGASPSQTLLQDHQISFAIPEFAESPELPCSEGQVMAINKAKKSLEAEEVVLVAWMSGLSEFTKLAAKAQWKRSVAAEGYEQEPLFATQKQKFFLAQRITSTGFETVAQYAPAPGIEIPVVIKSSSDISVERENDRSILLEESRVRNWWFEKCKGMKSSSRTVPQTKPVVPISFMGDLKKWLTAHEYAEGTGGLTDILPSKPIGTVLSMALRLVEAGIVMKENGLHYCHLSDQTLVTDSGSYNFRLNDLLLTDFSASAYDITAHPKHEMLSNVAETSLVGEVKTESPCVLKSETTSIINFTVGPTGDLEWREESIFPVEDEVAILWMVDKMFKKWEASRSSLGKSQKAAPFDLFALELQGGMSLESHLQSESCAGAILKEKLKDVITSMIHPKRHFIDMFLTTGGTYQSGGDKCFNQGQKKTLLKLEAALMTLLEQEDKELLLSPPSYLDSVKQNRHVHRNDQSVTQHVQSILRLPWNVAKSRKPISPGLVNDELGPPWAPNPPEDDSGSIRSSSSLGSHRSSQSIQPSDRHLDPSVDLLFPPSPP